MRQGRPTENSAERDRLKPWPYLDEGHVQEMVVIAGEEVSEAWWM